MNTSSSKTIDTIKAMLRQEAEYAVTDLQYTTDPNGIDNDARDKIVEWCCRVAGYCELQRETVCIAMNYTDRMCIRDPSILKRRTVYQLVAMTALYTAAKIHAPEAMDPKLVSHLSRETYSVDDIEEQERRLMTALQWRLNPPTAISFVRQYLELFYSSGVLAQRKAVIQCAMRQIEAYVVKYHCSTVVPEHVLAYCAVINALKTFLGKLVASMEYRLAHLIGLTTDDKLMTSETQYNLMLLIQVKPEQPFSVSEISERQSKRLRTCGPEDASVQSIVREPSNYSPTLISERCISCKHSSR